MTKKERVGVVAVDADTMEKKRKKKMDAVAVDVVEENKHMKKKHVIFDFDGTLADTIPVMFTIIQELAKEVGYARPITQADWDWVREHGLKDIPGKFNIPLIKIPYLLLQGRNKLKKQMFSIPPCRGMMEAVETLKKRGYSLAILSSNSRESIQEFIVKNNLASYFDFVHSELNIFGKDKALTSLMKQFGMTNEDSVYVGDEVRDFEACKKIGLDCISVTWGLNSRGALTRAGSTTIIDHAHELEELLP